MSTISITDFGVLDVNPVANASRVPSADHVGSDSGVPSVSRGLDDPPSAAIRKIVQGFPTTVDMNAICFPSGDHRGRAEIFPVDDASCSLSLPSTRLRHKS